MFESPARFLGTLVLVAGSWLLFGHWGAALVGAITALVLRATGAPPPPPAPTSPSVRTANGGSWWGYQIPWHGSNQVAYVGITRHRSPLDRWDDENHPVTKWPWALDADRAVVQAFPTEAAMEAWERATILAYAAQGILLLNRVHNPRDNWAAEPVAP